MSDEETKMEETPVSEAPTTETVAEETTPLADEVAEKLPGTEIRVIDIKPGMTVRVHEKIKDVNSKGEERERLQVFQGMVIGRRGSGISETFTIRREQKGYGVEKIFPIHCPTVAKVELVKTAEVRRAKLSYLQNLRHRFKRKLKEKWAVAK
jgi:large subunit ribosomal protein L19